MRFPCREKRSECNESSRIKRKKEFINIFTKNFLNHLLSKLRKAINTYIVYDFCTYLATLRVCMCHMRLRREFVRLFSWKIHWGFVIYFTLAPQNNHKYIRDLYTDANSLGCCCCCYFYRLHFTFSLLWGQATGHTGHIQDHK